VSAIASAAVICEFIR